MTRFILVFFILISGIGSASAGGGRYPTSFAYELVEIAYAYDITNVSWSPDGQWISYFTHIQENFASSGGFIADDGDLYFQHVETGERCHFEQAIYSRDTRHGNWLADGRYVAINQNNLYIVNPCADQETIILPEPIRSIDAYSDYRDALFLRADQATYLMTLDDGSIHLLDEIPDEHYLGYFLASATTSPNQRFFAVSLLGPGSSFRVDIDTAEVIYLYEEFRPGGESFLGEQPIAPYWLSDDLVLIATDTDNRGIEMKVVYADGSDIHEFEQDFNIDWSGAAIRLDDRYLMQVTQGETDYLYDSRNDALWSLFEHNFFKFEENGNYAVAYTDDSLAFASFQDNFRNNFDFSSHLEGRPGFLLGENYFVLSQSHHVTIYETRLGDLVGSVGFGHLYNYVGRAWSPDGITFALTGTNRLTPYADDATVLMLVAMSQFHIEPSG